MVVEWYQDRRQGKRQRKSNTSLHAVALWLPKYDWQGATACAEDVLVIFMCVYVMCGFSLCTWDPSDDDISFCLCMTYQSHNMCSGSRRSALLSWRSNGPVVGNFLAICKFNRCFSECERSFNHCKKLTMGRAQPPRQQVKLWIGDLTHNKRRMNKVTHFPKKKEMNHFVFLAASIVCERAWQRVLLFHTSIFYQMAVPQ